MWRIIPTTDQWRAWSLPSKAGYVGAVLSAVSIILAVVFFSFQSNHVPERPLTLDFWANGARERFNHTLHFHLANTNSRGVLVVDTIGVQVLSVRPYTSCAFPDGPWAPTPDYKYELTLSPEKKFYLLTKQEYSYKPFDLDKFGVLIKSTPNHWYDLRLVVKYYDASAPQEKRTVVSAVHDIAFPRRLDLNAMLLKAKRVDLFLNWGWSVYNLFIDRWTVKYNRNAVLRFVFSDSIRGITPDAMGSYTASKNYNVVPDSVYQKLTNFNPSYYKESKQFMILNDTLLISYINYATGQVIRDSSALDHLRKGFTWLYNERYFTKAAIDTFMMYRLHVYPDSLIKRMLRH